MPSNSDYIPRADAEFDLWLQNFMTRAATNQQELGISNEAMANLQALRANWINALQAQQQAAAVAANATQAKQNAREEMEEAIRLVVRQIQAQDIDDGLRAELRIPIRSATRTPAAVPNTRPVLQVDTRQRLQHTISFTDELTPSKRAKPDGVKGCEIRVKIGDPAPTDPQQTDFLALDSASPYVAEYTGSDAGKTAYYTARWVNSRGEPGPWSTTVPATITA